MTVADLIAELQRYPAQKPVRIVMSEVFFRDENGESMIPVAPDEAEEADRVSHEGAYILIAGR